MKLCTGFGRKNNRYHSEAISQKQILTQTAVNEFIKGTQFRVLHKNTKALQLKGLCIEFCI